MIYDNRIKRVCLSELDGVSIEEENFIFFNDKKLYVKSLSDDGSLSVGGNSSVFILYDKEGVEEEKVIKFSNYYKPTRNTKDGIKRRYGRFMNEIDVLRKIQSHPFQNNIVKLYEDGVCEISNREFPYYIMEKADSNLKEYLLKHSNNIDFVERIRLFRDIFSGIKTLHDLDFYHRDIKPDNILLFYLDDGDDVSGRTFNWKIGDLGLVAHRDYDYDDIGEKIGPFGWLSPEAMNKHLTEKSELGLDCTIDAFSDIFQMGKLFWFIFQYNVPIGQIDLNDFTFNLPNKEFVFGLIRDMLQYDKQKRILKSEIAERIELLAMDFGI